MSTVSDILDKIHALNVERALDEWRYSGVPYPQEQVEEHERLARELEDAFHNLNRESV